jgi:hypothetical protein
MSMYKEAEGSEGKCTEVGGDRVRKERPVVRSFCCITWWR